MIKDCHCLLRSSFSLLFAAATTNDIVNLVATLKSSLMVLLGVNILLFCLNIARESAGALRFGY